MFLLGMSMHPKVKQIFFSVFEQNQRQYMQSKRTKIRITLYISALVLIFCTFQVTDHSDLMAS